MKKSTMIKTLAFGFAVTALTGFAFTFAGCSGAEGAKYSLDLTEATVRAGGDAQRVSVLKDGKAYEGPVFWISENTNILSVEQGYIKGLREGMGDVLAYIYDGEWKYTLEITVTVTPALEMTLEDLYAYEGTGDVMLDIEDGLYTSGASYQIVEAKHVDGTDVTGDIYSNGGATYVKNKNETVLKAGKYNVTYRLFKDEYSYDFVRVMTIKNASRYEDVVFLEAFDGGHDIYGTGKNYSWTDNTQRDDLNPGEFITPTATAGEDKDQPTETQAEFQESLAASGYDGMMKEGVPGYDTFYRMYVNHPNFSAEPFPFVWLNLKYSAGDLWSKLGELPSTAKISVWGRIWKRPYGETEWQTYSGRWLYSWKVQAGSYTRIRGNSDALPVYNADGGWCCWKIPVSALVQNMGDALNYGFFVDAPVSEAAEVYFDFYTVELDAVGDVFAPARIADVTLAGDYTGLFDRYDYAIYNKKDGQLVYKGNSDNVKAQVAGGEYYVEYTLYNGTRKLPETFKRDLYSGVATTLESLSHIGKSPWGTGNKTSMVRNTPAAIGTPQASRYQKSGAITVDVKDTNGRNLPTFDITSIMDYIDGEYLKDSDYIGLWVYLEADGIEAGATFTPTFYLSHGAPHYDGASGTYLQKLQTGNTIYNAMNYVDPYTTGSAAGNNTQANIGYNQWQLIKVSVGAIRDLLKYRPDLTIDTLCINFSDNKANGKKITHYYHSLEFFMAEPSMNFDMFDQWGNDIEDWS